jgi:hypothetical protein
VGAFLLDSLICANLEGMHIWVAFANSYERGSMSKRNACTRVPNRFADADGTCADDEVCLEWTDHRTATPIHRRVAVRHLTPAPPRSKGERVVVLVGDNRGQIGVVEACKKKKGEAVVVLPLIKATYPFPQICRITTPN